MNYKQLPKFRSSAYELLNFAKDATFELMDAVLTTRNAYSLADFSLSPFFRRQWSSVYEAREDCRPSRNKLMRLYIEQMPTEERLVLGVDHTAWTRLHSPTRQDRTYQHQPSAITLNQPISIGQGYSTIAWIPEDEGSWALPLRLKNRLHWTVPQLSTPQQCERWSDLMPIMTWELGLARDLVSQYHLPWQKPIQNLTPGRVAQSISLLLPEIGTPAVVPKPRGKSPGWTEGNKSTKKPRYPVVKKGKVRHKKRSKKAS